MKGIKKQYPTECQLKVIPRVLSQTCLTYILLMSPTWRLKSLSWRSVAGNARSKVWEYFGFYQNMGPKTKENLDKTRVICGLCRKQSSSKGSWHVCFVDFVSVSLELLQCNLKLNKEHQPLLVELVFEAFSGPF